jgi:hypothetical protein
MREFLDREYGVLRDRRHGLLSKPHRRIGEFACLGKGRLKGHVPEAGPQSIASLSDLALISAFQADVVRSRWACAADATALEISWHPATQTCGDCRKAAMLSWLKEVNSPVVFVKLATVFVASMAVAVEPSMSSSPMLSVSMWSIVDVGSILRYCSRTKPIMTLLLTRVGPRSSWPSWFQSLSHIRHRSQVGRPTRRYKIIMCWRSSLSS